LNEKQIKSYKKTTFWVILSKIKKIEILEIITNANCLFFEDKRRYGEEKVIYLFKSFY
jgi:hypothetical protein